MNHISFRLILCCDIAVLIFRTSAIYDGGRIITLLLCGVLGAGLILSVIVVHMWLDTAQGDTHLRSDTRISVSHLIVFNNPVVEWGGCFMISGKPIVFLAFLCATIFECGEFYLKLMKYNLIHIRNCSRIYAHYEEGDQDVYVPRMITTLRITEPRH